jgi:hypothetical protein
MSVKFTLSRLVAAFVVGSVFAVGQTLNNPPLNPLPSAPHQPITGRQRFTWFVRSTIGPQTLAAGLFSAGISTARDNPEEYGPHWEGFAKRYGMRLTGISTGNAMEAGLGALWGEDPRYFRDAHDSIRGRLRRAVVMTFVAHNRKGNRMPAYARYISTPGNNFLSNTWRADSDATKRAAAFRTVWGVAGLMGKNAFIEFWPDIRQRILHKKR